MTPNEIETLTRLATRTIHERAVAVSTMTNEQLVNALNEIVIEERHPQLLPLRGVIVEELRERRREVSA